MSDNPMMPSAPPSAPMPTPPMDTPRPPNGLAPTPPNPHAWQNQAAAGIAKLNLSPDEVQQHIGQLSALVPKMGALLQKPNLSEKDVVKVAASAAEGGLTPTSQVVEQLLDMPTDPRALRQWVQNKFMGGMMALVQLKTVAQKMGLPMGETPDHLSSAPGVHKQ